MIVKYIYTTVLLCFFRSLSLAQEPIIHWDNLYNFVPKNLRYDTIDAEFLQERLINAYFVYDGIVKGDDFILYEENNKDLYKKGIFILDFSSNYYQNIFEKNPHIHFDTTSVFQVYSEIWYNTHKDGTPDIVTDINPFCDAYYKKYRMKIEVLYLGMVEQRLPLFMGCKELYKLKGKNYQLCTIPTYLITKVFNWQEI